MNDQVRLPDIVIVTGSRMLPLALYSGVKATINRLIDTKSVIIVGDCPTGLDLVVRNQCRLAGYPITVADAEWDTYGRKAGPIRNAAMIDSALSRLADTIVNGPLFDGSIRQRFWCYAWPIGDSPGTRDCMRRAKRAGAKIVNVTL